VFDAARKKSRLGSDQIKEVEKNFEATPSDASKSS
jgi:hypothetical protein